MTKSFGLPSILSLYESCSNTWLTVLCVCLVGGSVKEVFFVYSCTLTVTKLSFDLSLCACCSWLMLFLFLEETPAVIVCGLYWQITEHVCYLTWKENIPEELLPLLHTIYLFFLPFRLRGSFLSLSSPSVSECFITTPQSLLRFSNTSTLHPSPSTSPLTRLASLLLHWTSTSSTESGCVATIVFLLRSIKVSLLYKVSHGKTTELQ